MRFAIRVEVSLRPGIADPESATIERALPAMGFDEVVGMRSGRWFEFHLGAADEAQATKRAHQLADRLLANPVIESSTVRLLTTALDSSAGDVAEASPAPTGDGSAS